MREKADVVFKSKMSISENCFCDACHDTGRVMKIKTPITKYYDGENLSTKYDDYWLCAPCRTKLSHALDWPEDEGEGEI